MTTEHKPQNPTPPPGWAQIVLSVLAAFFGVQSARNRERDFRQGRAIHYILIGLVMTFLLIITVWIVVKLVLRAAGVPD